MRQWDLLAYCLNCTRGVKEKVLFFLCSPPRLKLSHALYNCFCKHAGGFGVFLFLAIHYPFRQSLHSLRHALAQAYRWRKAYLNRRDSHRVWKGPDSAKKQKLEWAFFPSCKKSSKQRHLEARDWYFKSLQTASNNVLFTPPLFF